jgi:hypothetical protein
MITLEAQSGANIASVRFVNEALDPDRKRRGVRYAFRAKGLDLRSCDVAADMARIASAVHLADRYVRRNLDSGRPPRRLSLTIGLAEPSRWKPVKAQLEDLAGFASEDLWGFQFEQGRFAKPKKTTFLDQPKASVVALFSGGLDSLCGAAHLADQGEDVLLVTHAPPGASTVARLIDPLPALLGKSRSSHFRTIAFSLVPQQHDIDDAKTHFQEFTRRTRPFFFLALASAAALVSGARRVQMSENGALGASLPIRRSHYGGRMTRQGHSLLLQGFADLMDVVVPSRGGWRYENPFSESTKGEACAVLGRGAHLAQLTVSCEYAGQQMAMLRGWLANHARGEPRFCRQCGLCVPCLVRRAAMRAAKAPDPSSDYFYSAPRVLSRLLERKPLYPSGKAPPLYEFAGGHVLYVARYAQEMLAMTPTQFSVQYLPELAVLRPALRTSSDIRRCLNLQRRFALELVDYLHG